MKIAIFTWGLSGGALANNAAAMAKGFCEAGVQVVYLVYLFDGPGRYVAVPEGVQLISLGVRHARWAPVPLTRFLRKYQPDVLISLLTIMNIPAIIGWLLAGKRHTKLVISEHAMMSYEIYVEHKGEPWMQTLPWLARILYPKADGLRANSQAVLNDLLTRIRVPIRHNRVIVIPNPVNIDAVYSHSLAKPDHPWLQQEEEPVIVSVGRLARTKNFPLLLKAFTIVRKKLDVKLIIFGEGPERDRLEGLIAELGIREAVSLPGFSANPWSSMAKARVFVLPSEEEAFGQVLVEAMACGVPVVATDTIGGGPRIILQDGKNGILVPSGHPEALADAILKVMNSADLRDRLVAAGKQRCKAFRPEIVMQQWFSFLQKLYPHGLLIFLIVSNIWAKV